MKQSIFDRKRQDSVNFSKQQNNHDMNIEAHPKFIFLPRSQSTLLICMVEEIIAKPFCQCRFVIGPINRIYLWASEQKREEKCFQ